MNQANIDTSIFKAYDIRGIYPTQLDEHIAEGVAKSFINILKPTQIILGRDCRTSGPSLHQVVLSTLLKHGVSVIDIGQASTDMYYYACATKNLPGIMITASHNPKEYNGFKMVRKIPYFFTGDDEIARIKNMIVDQNFGALDTSKQGQVENWDVMPEFIDKLLEKVTPSNWKPTTIVADTANGMVGPIIQALEPHLPQTTIIPMYFEPDGNFPNHGGDPLQPENRQDILKKISENNTDFGVMTDPDGDRFFVIDNKGRFIQGDFLTAILAEYFLNQKPGAKIVYDIRASKVVPETITSLGGVPLYNRVGHSYIKKRMIDEDALFGGEVTGHYYFTDFFYCDSGILTLVFLLDFLNTKEQTLSQIIDDMESKYFISGEINSKVESVPSILEKLEKIYQSSANEILKVDGLSVEFENWRFNVRGSNTEPLIRLNLEATSKGLMEEKRDEVLAQIRS